MITKVGVAASLALAANALLLPPNLVADGFGDDNAMETLAINPLKRTISLECPSCAYAEVRGKSLAWTQNAGSSYLLDFEVGVREDTLDIDGVQLYPPTFGHFAEPFYVTQVNPQRESDGVQLRVTGYTFHFNSAETVTEAGTELLPMTFRITSIESKPVNPPAITINLLKDATGRLMIASFETVTAVEDDTVEQDKECTEWSFVCKWRAMLAHKIDRMRAGMRKGCHKHKGTMGNSRPDSTEAAQADQHYRHHRHHRHHRMHMAMHRILTTIIIPILVGISAGALTYLVCMGLGFLVAVIVTKIRGESLYERVADEEQVIEESEKEVLEELPQYEAPPKYQDAS